MEYDHTPVMLDSVLEYLKPQPGGLFVDATLGGGGYAFALAERAGGQGRVVAIDLDQLAIDNAEKKISAQKINNIVLVHDNFKNLQSIVNNNWPDKTRFLDGIVFDLGLSSAQLADKSRGFSFQLDAPLDMAFGQREGENNKFNSTKHIVNNWKRERLADIIYRYGEEKRANAIASAIAKERERKEIETSAELSAIIGSAIPAVERRKMRIHPATKTFQALRIATNKELENLEKVLPPAVGLLKPGGRIAVVSYHSLEDRIVKQYFQAEARDCQCPPEIPICRCQHQAQIEIITRHVIKPSPDEIEKNPRARSARLRVAEKK